MYRSISRNRWHTRFVHRFILIFTDLIHLYRKIHLFICSSKHENWINALLTSELQLTVEESNIYHYLQSRQVKRTPPSCEYFVRTSLYLVRLKIFEWIKFIIRHLHQIQGNWAGRNFVTESRVNSRLITHARMQRWICNCRRIQLSNNKFIKGILGGTLDLASL